MLTRAHFLSIGFVCLIGCSQAPTPTSETNQKPPVQPAKPIGAVVEIKAPLGLPPVPVPADNPPTAETIALGRKLYYDGKLSVDQSISCASCHHPQLGFGDGKPVS